MIDVTNYMAGLAALHTSLNHRPPKEKHFFRGELEEFYNKLRSDVKFPCMILEGSEIDYIGQTYNLAKVRHCAFMIVDNIEKMRDYEEIQVRMSKCEKIGEQIMGRIIQEAGKPETGSPFAQLVVSDMSAEYWHNEVQKYVAFRMKFTVKGRVQLCGTDVWRDLRPLSPVEPIVTPMELGRLLTEGNESMVTEMLNPIDIEK